MSYAGMLVEAIGNPRAYRAYEDPIMDVCSQVIEALRPYARTVKGPYGDPGISAGAEGKANANVKGIDVDSARAVIKALGFKFQTNGLAPETYTFEDLKLKMLVTENGAGTKDADLTIQITGPALAHVSDVSVGGRVPKPGEMTENGDDDEEGKTKLTLDEMAKLQWEIIKFFRSLKAAPKDEAIHELAEKMKINPHVFEGAIYDIVWKQIAFRPGKHAEVPDSKFDAKELKMGIEVEKEHTDNPDLAREIAADHLSEFPDYYTRLAKMEAEAKAAKK